MAIWHKGSPPTNIWKCKHTQKLTTWMEFAKLIREETGSPETNVVRDENRAVAEDREHTKELHKADAANVQDKKEMGPHNYWLAHQLFSWII